METADEPRTEPEAGSDASIWTWSDTKSLLVWLFLLVFGLPLLVIGAFLAVIGFLLLILFLISLPFLAVIIPRLQETSERHFQREMLRKGRFIAWEKLEPELIAGRGTLILEQGGKAPIRYWWTAEDVVSISPFKIPSEDDLNGFMIPTFQKPHRFVLWCHSQFLDEKDGKALVTEPGIEVPPGYGHAGFFQERYPGLTAIDTVYLR